MVIEGKKRNISNRKFCLDCSPFGKHNTKPVLDNVEQPKPKSSGPSVCKRRRQLKFKLIEYKGGKCQRCGYDKKIPRAYAFHHLDPKTKDFNVSGVSVSWERMTEEVDKCILLCQNCHAEVHHELWVGSSAWF